MTSSPIQSPLKQPVKFVPKDKNQFFPVLTQKVNNYFMEMKGSLLCVLTRKQKKILI